MPEPNIPNIISKKKNPRATKREMQKRTEAVNKAVAKLMRKQHAKMAKEDDATATVPTGQPRIDYIADFCGAVELMIDGKDEIQRQKRLGGTAHPNTIEKIRIARGGMLGALRAALSKR